MTNEELINLIIDHIPDDLPEYMIDAPTGWLQIIADLHNELVQQDPEYRINQIKEKFGGLRFYYSPGREQGKYGYLHELMEKYEALSYKTCQICAEPGAMREINGWYATLCNACQAEKVNKN